MDALAEAADSFWPHQLNHGRPHRNVPANPSQLYRPETWVIAEEDVHAVIPTIRDQKTFTADIQDKLFIDILPELNAGVYQPHYILTKTSQH